MREKESESESMAEPSKEGEVRERGSESPSKEEREKAREDEIKPKGPRSSTLS